MIKLITCSDDRSGRKGGRYEATQEHIARLLDGWLPQTHYTLADIMGCDPLMQYPDAAMNGRVYKPWCIAKELAEMEEGDYLIYNDCSPELWPAEVELCRYRLGVIKALTDRAGGVLVGFVKWSDKHLGPGDLGKHTHHNFTLDSCIGVMAGSRYRHSYLCASGMICIRKSEVTTTIVDRWLFYNRRQDCCAMRIDEHEDSYHFLGGMTKLGNRHDQSVLSMVLCQLEWQYCDIVYNDMNPYNFLNFCHPGHDYKFLPANPAPKGRRNLKRYQR